MDKDKTLLNKVGDHFRGFKVTKVFPIKELQCELIELIHEKTGARVLHIANDDPENLFCLSFQTLPESSNGVAHILEHTVLCGSKKFPVKDPFFAMTRRSLNTFMNAFTGSDFTCYPAASQVEKDFYNLLEVYLDAVFHPILNELSFLQEGWRLEFAVPDDVNSSLEFKGIVFNEMKGALVSGSSRLSECINAALFPNLTYGINSGGDPKDIPSLTYEQLKEFHEKYYHPSRCLFFFYGNLPLSKHLEFISDQLLDHVEPKPQLPPVPLQKRFSEPVFQEHTYPISDEEEKEDKTMIAMAWLTCHILEQEELLALSVIEIALMDNDASPLKMALLKSGLCKQAHAYVETEITEIPFVLVMKGCNPQDAEALQKTVFMTLEWLAIEGIPLELIENAIHQLEFYRSEITGDSAPFGLSLFMRSALLKQHGGLPEDGLMIHTLFSNLRKRIAEDPKYLSERIRKYFLDNSHFVRIVMKPDAELANKELEAEKAVLAKLKEGLSEEAKSDIVRKSKELAALQESQNEQDQDVLPKVTLKDVPKHSRDYDLIVKQYGNLEVFYHSCFTNEIVYADLVFPLPRIKEEDLSYVRLFSSLLTQMGCAGRDYVENLAYIQGNTGGVGAGMALNIQAADHSKFYPSFHVKGKAVYRKTEQFFKLLHDLVWKADFSDIPRLKEIIMKQYTALQSSLNQNAMKYAINLSATGINEAAKIANDWYGLNYYWKIQDLAQNFDAKAKDLVQKMEELKEKLLGLKDAQLVITCDQHHFDGLVLNRFYGLQDMEDKEFCHWIGGYSLPKVHPQGRVVSSPVAFTSQVINTIPYVHRDAPALNLAAHLMDNVFLHTRLREQGGAYGGGASSNAISGSFYFYSYRDPNISSTFKAFQEAAHFIMEGKFDDDDLEEAKLEMIQAMDSPVSPGSRGDLAYGWLREGRTPEVRQAFRERLLSLTKRDIQKAVKHYLIEEMSNATPVAFAGRELLEKENAKLELAGINSLKIETI